MPDFTLTTKEVGAQLRISETTLRRLRLAGVLKPGIHFRAVGMGTIRPTLLWNAEVTNIALAERSGRVLN